MLKHTKDFLSKTLKTEMLNTEKKVIRKGKKINAPFGYFGSKNKIALQLCTNLPPHNCWVEAFCGSAALTLRKRPSSIEVINDIDSEIINFFNQLRNNEDKLLRSIELTPYAEQELINSRISVDNLSDLEKARRFLVQSMMAINGIFGEERGGFSYTDSYTRNNHDARVNRWNNLPDRLKLVVKRLKDVRIENKDARKLILRYINRPATLIYLDPPYFADRTNGYNNDANDECFHKELLVLINNAKCMIFISGYENELYSQYLSSKRGWERKEINTTTKDSKGVSHERTEVVWMNRHFVSALSSNEVPIQLTKKELLQKKVNPIRI
ncbi:MAG: DNA adenine methylase [Ignavibacteria bacterium]|nr:DNA adenine methylase [Ignavibacteria bacterium]